MGLIGVLYIMVNPAKGEKFTEFYILGPDGKAGNYPSNMGSGQSSNLTVGIVNHEQNTTSYQIVIKNNGEPLKEENITLQDNEMKEIPFNFTADYKGQNKLEFNLYKLPDTQNSYRYLFIEFKVS